MSRARDLSRRGHRAMAAAMTEDSITKAHVGLGNVANVDLSNVTNESKATMFTSPTFTGTPAGITKTHVGLSAVTNDAQIKTDGSNAPNLLKNEPILTPPSPE